MSINFAILYYAQDVFIVLEISLQKQNIFSYFHYIL